MSGADMKAEFAKVEETLRGQRAQWQEIYQRISTIPARDLSPEPPKRILLFGIGSSHFAARLISFALIRDKSRNRIPVLACSSLGIGQEVFPQKGDWAFGISHSGKTAATLSALELCDRTGVFTVLVSATGVEVPSYVRYSLPTVPLETAECHTAAVTGAICAVTSLLLGPRGVEEWDAVRSIGEPDLEIVRRRAGAGPSIIVGEWEGEWMAKETALKIMELAKVPVRAYSSEEYLHGPHESASQADRIWHISLPKDPHGEDFKPAHSIGVFGSSPLAWVPALVELQWLALGVAMNRAEM